MKDSITNRLKNVFILKRTFQLQTKLFLAYFLSFEIILISFAFFFYLYVSPILIKQELDKLETVNETFMDQIDAGLEALDTVSANINYSSLMSDKLGKSFNLNIQQEDLPNLANLFITINGTDLKADQINLYDFDGNMIRVGLSTKTDFMDPTNIEWFEEVYNLNGNKHISEPFKTMDYSLRSTNPNWFISLQRTYNDPYGRKIGFVETIKQCKKIFNPIITYYKKYESSMDSFVFNENGIMVYPYDFSKQPGFDTSDYYNFVINHLSNISYYNPYFEENERIIHHTSKYSGWTYVSTVPESAILKPISRLTTFLVLVVGIVFILSLILAYYLAKNMARPVKSLKDVIQKLEIESLGTTPENDYTTSYNELDEVYHAFQYLSKKLKVSMDELIDTKQQELKSRTLALQSQTNPHFYYNTLSSIIVLAENGQNEEVIKICRNLTQIMRYITDTTSQLVSVEEEISYVEKYLYCMKVRYQSSLSFNINIDDRLLKKKIPKLIIQPLVENALKYGTNCLPPWTITVSGYYKDSCWIIEILDSGEGFSEEAVGKINSRIEYTANNPGMPDFMIDGLGMINVFMRWKIFCKGKHIFEYGNTKEGNGSVKIGIKLLKEKSTKGEIK